MAEQDLREESGSISSVARRLRLSGFPITIKPGLRSEGALL
jgi:hypothetical protein